MDLSALFCLPNRLGVCTVRLLAGALCIEASACRRACACPDCQTPSEHVHSYYTRTVAYLPCVGRSVTLRLHVRKFRGTNDCCPRRVFSERFPEYVRPRARKTLRVGGQIRTLGLLLGGRANQPQNPHTLLGTLQTLEKTP